MPTERNAVLHLPGEGSVEAALLRDLLAAAHDAHSGFIAFDRIVSDLDRWYREFPVKRRYIGIPSLWHPADWDRPGLADSFVFGDELLLVTRVELGSPGFWEFAGALNPLEVTRKYLQDRHVRKQDRQYRQREEERRLGLENDLREIDVIRERLNIAREYGVPEEALAPLLEKLVGQPLSTLGALQDRGVIDGSRAQIRELPRGEGGEPTGAGDQG
jgi:hypothetical protein